jgi:hypothetical protein
MLSGIARVLVSRASTIIIDLVVITLMVLALQELIWDFATRPAHAEARSIIAGVSVVMIGWGVALEERAEVRSLFGLKGAVDEEWQNRIDRCCNGVGVMLLLAGLFAEIFEELVVLPRNVLSMRAVHPWLLGLGALCVAGGLVILVRHVVTLLAIRRGR